MLAFLCAFGDRNCGAECNIRRTTRVGSTVSCLNNESLLESFQSRGMEMTNRDHGHSPFLVRAAVAAALGTGLCVAGTSAWAAEEEVEQELAEVVITGSRIARPDYN